MNRDDLQKLLGGYATGTLTPEEQQALFEAALDDQELFDAIAQEQPLRDLLRDQGAKAELLGALDREPVRWYHKLTQGWRPLAAAAAMAGVGAFAVVVWQGARPAKPVLVAQVTRPQLPAAAEPATPSASADQSITRQAPSNAPSDRLAKQSPAQAAAVPERAAEEDRRAKPRQLTAPVQKDISRADADKPSAAAEPAPRPAPPAGRMASGFRQGALPGAAPRAERPLNTGSMANAGAQNSVGAVGGITGGLPSAPVPAPPKTEAAPQQSAQSNFAAPASPTPFQQGQQGNSQNAAIQTDLPLNGRQQIDQIRLAQQQSASTENVRVQTAPSRDLAMTLDARTLFYGGVDDRPAFGVSAGRGGGGSEQERKKAAATEATPALNQRTVVAATSSAKAAQTRVAYLGMRYSILRQTAGGTFELVNPSAVKAGDTIELQLTPNQGGTLRVRARRTGGTWREVMSQEVQVLQTYTSPLLRSGETEVEVTLTRDLLAMTGGSLRDQSAGAYVRQQSTTEPATYMVSEVPARQLQFTIHLNNQ